MANLSQDQVKDIISKAPKGTSPAGIVAALREQGHVLQGYQTAPPSPEFSQGKEQGLAAKAGKFLVGDIAEAGYQGTQAALAPKQVEQVGQQNIQSADVALKAARELNTNPNLTPQQRAARIDIAKKSIAGEGQQNPANVAPIIQKTPEQLAGTMVKGAVQVISDISMAGGGLTGTAKPNPMWVKANPVKAKILTKYLPVAVEGVIYAGTAAGGEAMSQGKDFKETAKDIAIGAAFGAGTNVALIGAMDMASWGFRTAYSKLAGVPKPAVDVLIKDKSMIDKVREMTGNDTATQQQIVNDYHDGLREMQKHASDNYQSFLKDAGDRTYIGEVAPVKGYDSSGIDYSLPKEQLAKAFDDKANALLGSNQQPTNRELYDFYKQQSANVTKRSTLSAAEKAGTIPNKLDTSPAYKGSGTEFENKSALWWKNDKGVWEKTNLTVGGVKQKINGFLTKPTIEGGLGIKKLPDGTLGFNAAKVGPEMAKPVGELIDTVNNWDDFTPNGLNVLRQRIGGKYVEGAVSKEQGAMNRMITDLNSNLSDYISDKIGKDNPIAKMNSDYSAKIKIKQAIEEELGKGKDTQAQFDRLLRLTKEKTPLKVQKMTGFDKATSKELLNSLYAYTMASWANRNKAFLGLEGVAALGGAITAGVTANAPLGAGIAAGAVMSSPRAGAEVINAVSPAAKYVKNIIQKSMPVISSKIGQEVGR